MNWEKCPEPDVRPSEASRPAYRLIPAAGNSCRPEKTADGFPAGSAPIPAGFFTGLVSAVSYLMTPEEEPYLPPESRVLPHPSRPSIKGGLKTLFWMVVALLVTMILARLH